MTEKMNGIHRASPLVNGQGGSQLPKRNHRIRNIQFIKPQISIEEVDDPQDHRSSVSPQPLSPPLHQSGSCSPKSKSTRTLYFMPTDSPTHLTVTESKSKSRSLPSSVRLEDIPNSLYDTHESDSSDSHHSTDSASDYQNGKRFVPVHENETRKPRSETMDSEYYMLDPSSSDLSSDAEDSPPEHRKQLFKCPSMETSAPDAYDDVFNDAELNMCTVADTKLVVWASNVFVPACRTLLYYCGEAEVDIGVVQSCLRNLSNYINFFCSEHQRLSGILKPLKGISLSVSTNSFQKLDKVENRPASACASAHTSITSISSTSTTTSGFASQDSLVGQSYAIKVLRSISFSLIDPLQEQAAQEFSPTLYKAIVVAVQKISWKVEACLSFNDPTKEFDIHGKIFDLEQTVKVRDVMINALPPEEPKLQTAALGSRSNSVSSSGASRKASEGLLVPLEGSVPMGNSITRRRHSGGVYDPENLPRETQGIIQKEEEESRIDSFEESRSASSTPKQLRKYHTSGTIGVAEEILRSSRVTSRYGSTPNVADTESLEPDDSFDYFRPKAYRRTTVSLSKREVHSLGLTVAKRVDETILKELKAQRRKQSLPEGKQQKTGEQEETTEPEMEKLQVQQPVKLTRDMERMRSASLGDLLNVTNESSTVEPPVIDGQDSETSSSAVPSPTGTSPLTYTPTFSRRHSDHSGSNDWVLVDKSSPKIKGKKPKSKKPVEKSLSTSGKLTFGLLKTARAFRTASTSKSNLSRSMGSAEMLSENTISPQDSLGPRPSSALSDPRGYLQTPAYDERAGTLPSKSRMNTLARLVRRARDRPASKSFGKSDAKSKGFSRWAPQELASSGTFVESIENYSRDASRKLQEIAPKGEEQLLVSVDVAGKLPKTKASKRRSLSKESSSTWFEITVTTNMKQFGRNHYTILRPFKEMQQLYDALASAFVGLALPERPDKKIMVRKQKQLMEELLRYVAGNPNLRSFQPFVNFLMPDDAFGTFTENESEVSFELLMTFYTPDVYPGPPACSQSIQVVSAEIAPTIASPSQSQKHSTLHKKGSLHYMKNKDGKEDPSTFVIREEGRDALIVSYVDERYVVVAGTFEKLVEQLACEEKPDPRFVATFLLGYCHFAPTFDFLAMLLRRFHMTVAPNATDEEIAYAEKWRYVVQLRVLDILTYWMKKCWPDFYRNPPVLDKVREFVQYLKTSDDTNFQLAGNNLSTIIKEKLAISSQYALPASPSSLPGTETPDSMLTVNGTVRHYSSSSVGGCVDISTLTAIQLARQLTLIELQLLRAIEIHELVVYTWEPNSEANKPYRSNLDAFIARFNKVSYWVASEICTVKDARARGALIEKFIEVAKHCQEYKNFNTTISVISGLSLAAVRRLKRSWEHVGEKTMKAFNKLSLIVSPTTNHTSYRRALAAVHRRDPCIPYFGVFMRDLTFFNDGNRKTLKNGLLNFSKLRTIVLKFEEMKRYQRSKYFFPPEDKTMEFCRNLWCMNESDLYDVSLVTEPRAPPPESPETSV